MVATKCQAAPIYDLLWIAVSNQFETVALFKTLKPTSFRGKDQKESEGRPKISFIWIVDKFSIILLWDDIIIIK